MNLAASPVSALPSHRAAAPAAVPGMSRGAVWTGRAISALCIAFLAFDAIGKLVLPAPVREAFAAMGMSLSLAPVLGVVLLASTALYALPRTAPLGAALLTAYLGGATAVHAVLGELGWMAISVGVLVWLGLALRDPRVRALINPAPR